MIAIEVTLPIRAVSEANVREHWAAKAARVKRQRRDVYLGLYNLRGMKPPIVHRVVVVLTRVAPRMLDGDNNVRSLKAVVDEVAAFLGLDDRDDRIQWLYAQAKGKPNQYAVKVRVEWHMPK
jgi:hypothetical protein